MQKIIAWVAVWLLLFSVPIFAQDWTKESKDRAKRTALHDITQIVRGDTGKWNDHAILQHAPPIGMKPAKMGLDVWADLLLKQKVTTTDKDDNWLILRTSQLDDNDRVWVERIDRRGSQITVVVNHAKWLGKYFRNFTYYQAIALNLGKLEPGNYETKCIIQPLVFTKFEGDGKAANNNWPKDERAAATKPAEMRLEFIVGKSSR